MSGPGTRATMWRLFTSIVFILAMLRIFAPTTLAAGACPTSEGDLQSLMSAGGTVTLDCPGNTTIPFSSLITINNTVTLDASSSSGKITLDGQGITSLLTVNPGGNLTVNGLIFTGGGSNNDGGGISVYGTATNGATATITNSVFTGNTGYSNYFSGGALAVNEGTLNISRSTFTGNSDWESGAIDSFNSSVNISDSTFSRNSAQEGGVILAYTNLTYNPPTGSNSKVIISNSTFSQNTGYDDGAVLSNYHTPATISNSTFSGNGGQSTINMVQPDSPTTLLNNTFAGNNDSFVAINAYGSMLTEGGNIFDNNSYSSCWVTSIVDLGYNVDPSGSCTGNHSGVGDVGGDPMLGTLADNGGPTQTIALLPGSPAIDHIPTSYTFADANGNNVPLCPSTDQRGTARPDDGEAFCDAGAFESDLSPTPTDTTPPVITPNVSGTLGSNNWYTSDVTVTWSLVDAESNITSSNGCNSTTITSDTTGTTLTCMATSAGGTNSQSVTIMRDATSPTLSPSVSPNPVLLNGSATADPHASDTTSGIASSSCDPLNTSSAGAHTVNCSATDSAGNTASAPAGYTVTYQFSGFTSPVDSSGLTVAKAGQTIPLKWRLTDANGNPVANLSSVGVTVVGLQCTAGTSGDQVSEYASGASGLQNLGNGYYQFNWATPKSYANSCKTMRLNLGEGSSSNPIYHTADFSFTK